MNIKFETKQENEYYIDEGCHIIEIMNTVENPDISISQARVEPFQSTELHSLKHTFEYYYILKGEATVQVGNNEYEVKKGDLVKIDILQPQRISNHLSTDLLFLCICTPRFKHDNYISEKPRE